MKDISQINGKISFDDIDCTIEMMEKDKHKDRI